MGTTTRPYIGVTEKEHCSSLPGCRGIHIDPLGTSRALQSWYRSGIYLVEIRSRLGMSIPIFGSSDRVFDTSEGGAKTSIHNMQQGDI
jgi:hypothetical protein